MGVLTIETYYSLLEKCTLEAFETLKLKDYYPNDGTKAVWDVSSFTIEKTNDLLSEKEKDLFKKEYISDSMRVTFLTALERYCKDFEIRYSITRIYFYKKCYESLLFKTSQSKLWNEPNFGFNIDLEPCILTFIWNMSVDIEARSKETIETKQKHKISNDYKFNQTSLLNILNLKNEDNSINQYHYLKLFNQYKNDLNENLNKFNFENEYLKYLRNFNVGIESLLVEIIKHYKNVMNFENSKMQNFEHYNYRDSVNLKASLSFLKSYSIKLIDFKLENKNIYQLKKIQEYCINTLTKSLESLKSQFEIEVFESPLKIEFLEIEKSLKKAINKNDLNQFEAHLKKTESEIISKQKKDLSTQKWFEVGLKLATGEAFEIYKKLKSNQPTEICRRLKIPTTNKTYISATLTGKDSDKNIFNYTNKLIALHEHIHKNNLNFGTEFLEKYNQIERD